MPQLLINHIQAGGAFQTSVPNEGRVAEARVGVCQHPSEGKTKPLLADTSGPRTVSTDSIKSTSQEASVSTDQRLWSD